MTTADGQPSFLATRRGKLTLALLCAIAFLDFVDGPIVNIALPDIRSDLHFSVQNLQWVVSGYLLTYGGFMLLGGRLADLLGRRRVLVTGATLFASSSLAGGFATSGGVLVGARLAEGLGAALMLPAALSLVTTNFTTAKDRATALGLWGGVAGLASAAGVFLGGLLTEGPGWRWVLFVNPPIAAGLMAAVFVLIPAEKRRASLHRFDIVGTLLVTGGMLLLVFALVKAPDQGWGSARTIAELLGAATLLVAFVLIEHQSPNPLIPLTTFQIKGLAPADVTMLVGAAGIIAVFYFLTLYMQLVLGFSPMQTGAAYLPFTAGVAVVAGSSSQLLTRIGTRPVLVGGALIASAGLYELSHLSVGGSYLRDLLPGMIITSIGLGALFVAVTTAANAGVPADRAGLAAALMNACQQVGGAVGLAVFMAVAAARTNHLFGTHASSDRALTAGFQRALLVESLFVLAAALVALRTTNSRGEIESGAPRHEVATAARQ